VTLTFDLDIQWASRSSEVVEVHVHAKFHQAKCSDSLVIVVRETKNSPENNTDSKNTSAQHGHMVRSHNPNGNPDLRLS